MIYNISKKQASFLVLFACPQVKVRHDCLYMKMKVKGQMWKKLQNVAHSS